MNLIANPYLVVKENLSRLYSSYCGPLRRDLSVLEIGMGITKETIKHKSAYRYICLRIVSCGLRNIIFVAFHANPICGHVSLPKTVSVSDFASPGLYTYHNKVFSSCVGYKLASATTSSSKELIHGFPIDVPMAILHVDG